MVFCLLELLIWRVGGFVFWWDKEGWSFCWGFKVGILGDFGLIGDVVWDFLRLGLEKIIVFGFFILLIILWRFLFLLMVFIINCFLENGFGLFFGFFFGLYLVEVFGIEMERGDDRCLMIVFGWDIGDEVFVILCGILILLLNFFVLGRGDFFCLMSFLKSCVINLLLFKELFCFFFLCFFCFVKVCFWICNCFEYMFKIDVFWLEIKILCLL